MRVIIAGSRSINSYIRVECAIHDSGFVITEVLSGCASGVDRLGELWAQYANIPVRRFPADWDQYGKRAGYLRNEQMAQNADALIAVWDGTSRGTAHMLKLAQQYGLKIHKDTLCGRWRRCGNVGIGLNCTAGQQVRLTFLADYTKMGSRW